MLSDLRITAIEPLHADAAWAAYTFVKVETNEISGHLDSLGLCSFSLLWHSFTSESCAWCRRAPRA